MARAKGCGASHRFRENAVSGIRFTVNEDLLMFPPADRKGFVGKGGLFLWGPAMAWTARKAPLYLGTWEHLSPDERAALIEKARKRVSPGEEP